MTEISVILLKLPRISELVADSDLIDLDHENDEESDQGHKNNSDSDLVGNNSVSYESQNSSSDSAHPQDTRISLLPVFSEGAVGRWWKGPWGRWWKGPWGRAWSC